MSTTTAIAALAASQSALAASQARQARITACKALVPHYNAQTATIAEARSYADCIFLLHPDPQPSDTSILVLKATIVCAIVSASWLGWLNRDEDFLMVCVVGLLGAILGAALPILLYGLYLALLFLFS